MSPVWRCYAVPVPPEMGPRQRALFESTILAYTLLRKIWPTGINRLYWLLCYNHLFLKKKSHSDIEKCWFSSTNINSALSSLSTYAHSYLHAAACNGSCYYLLHRVSKSGEIQSQVYN